MGAGWERAGVESLSARRRAPGRELHDAGHRPPRTDLDLAPPVMHVPRKRRQVHDEHHLRERNLNLGRRHAVDEVGRVARSQ